MKDSVLTVDRFRVYCANPPCANFLHPTAHITDPETNITYAVCENEECNKLTCTGCRTLIEQGTQDHVCKKDEDEEKFKQTATEKGYQECSICGATVELTEACNHITYVHFTNLQIILKTLTNMSRCECGHDFCYVCGKDWTGLHGCPHYGPAFYDAEDYNQDGYHRNTGLNREGLTYRQEIARRRREDHDDEDEDEDIEDDREEGDPDWEVLQHIEPDERIAINTLLAGARDDALDQLRITLFETRGIMFGQDPPPAQEQQVDEQSEDENEDEDEPEDTAAAEDQGTHGINIPDEGRLDIDLQNNDHDVLVDDEYLPPFTDTNDNELNSDDRRRADGDNVPIEFPTGDPVAGRAILERILHNGDVIASANGGSQPRPGTGYNDVDSPPTEPEDARPATPMDIVAPADIVDEHAESVVKEGFQRLWGPPGGWPGGDDGEL